MRNKRLTLLASILFGLVLIMSLISTVSAEIVFSQPSSLYNFGSELSSQVQITAINPGYLDINLFCNGVEKNLYHNVPDSKTITLKRSLTPAYIGNLTGSCFLSALYGSDSGQSASFVISNQIRVTLSTSQQDYEAGKVMLIKGQAVKENGVNLGTPSQGFIDIYLGDEIKASDTISNGIFSINFTIPETTHAGNYSLKILVYDKDSQGNILNQGEQSLNIGIIQKPAKINLAIESTSLIPGNNLTLIPFLYDLAGDEMNYPILLQVKDSFEGVLYQGIINSNQNFILQTKTNTAPGNLKIIAQKDEIIAEKDINVLELYKLNAELQNQTLVLTNIGNMPYNRIMQFQIGNETVMKEVVLGLNETEEYDISAPDGTYDVKIKDDNSEILSAPGMSITGDVISVQEAGARINNFITEYPAVWLFVLVVVLGFLYSWFRKYQGTRFLGPFHEKINRISLKEKRASMQFVLPKREKLEQTQFQQRDSYKKINIVNVKNIKTNQNIEKININGSITQAEQVSSLQGQKQQVSVIAIKIKSGKLFGMAKENIAKALEYAYDKKGASYISGDYILVLFSELLTKNKNNESTAINVAKDIEKFLEGHNRKFRDELTYGIGVNCGQLIIKVENNILRFVSIEKTIITAKKMADASSGEALLGQDIHLKTANSVKADKVKIGDVEAFKVKRIVDTQASEKFIKEFMRRTNFEKQN